MDTGEGECKRLGMRYNDLTCTGSLWFGCIIVCPFMCDCALSWMCVCVRVCVKAFRRQPVLACASVLKGYISRWASVVVRKASFTPTYCFPHWPQPLATTQNMSARWSKQSRENSALPPPTQITPVTFHFIPAVVLMAPSRLVWTPTVRLCDREKISTHWLFSV